MLYWDTTKTGKRNYPASGIKRVSDRLFGELEAAGQPITPVKWDKRTRTFIETGTKRLIPPDGTFLTPEIFDEHDRPGFTGWTRRFKGAKLAIFHDAIPIRHPGITWPDSVTHHPHYMKLLGTAFNKVFAVSKESEADLRGYWDWLELGTQPKTHHLQWGADSGGQSRNTAQPPPAHPINLLQVGILEPRKNQELTLEVCETLWAEGHTFQLHLAGRNNPHFAKPIIKCIKKLRKAGRPLTWHKSPGEAELQRLYAQCHLCLFPSVAEGCGLPVLEALWAGRPVLASNLDCIRENAAFGGVRQFDLEDPGAMADSLRSLLTDTVQLDDLAQQARNASLPTWKDTAADLVAKL